MKGAKERFKVKEISLDLIDRPEDPDRMHLGDNEVDELAASIKERGLLQPITVAERNGRYEIVYGDRRFLAHKVLGLDKIACVIREYDENEIAVDRAVENLQRVDLTVLEEAMVYQRMMDKGGLDDGKIGKLVGKSGGVVKRKRHLLRMPRNFQEALHSGRVSPSVAEYLMGVGEESHRDYLLEMAVEHGVTLIVARGWVDDWKRSQREIISGNVGGVRDVGVYEEKAIYVSCDICGGPENLNNIKRISACKGCFKIIVKTLRGED
ncbi:MAG TPA: ParB/RepB/Spo0J family partition protein [Desulfatiglandales bacterium]|nr:ParB/RepB/Spo0J family partition protein [Desulfatiglandales bacterium]